MSGDLMSNTEWKDAVNHVVEEFEEYADPKAIIGCMVEIYHMVDRHEFNSYTMKGRTTYDARMKVMRDLLKRKGYNVPFRSGHYVDPRKEKNHG